MKWVIEFNSGAGGGITGGHFATIGGVTTFAGAAQLQLGAWQARQVARTLTENRLRIFAPP